MNLIFCGLPRSGKTTLGKKVSQKLHWPLIDTDLLLGPAAAMLYREIGEEAFRKREEKVIESLKGVQSSVIVLGGGALLSAQNQFIVKYLGLVIYLKTPLDVIQQRIDSESQRPPFLEKVSLKELAFNRCPIYEEMADVVLNGKREGVEWVETLLDGCLGLQHGGSPTGLQSVS